MINDLITIVQDKADNSTADSGAEKTYADTYMSTLSGDLDDFLISSDETVGSELQKVFFEAKFIALGKYNLWSGINTILSDYDTLITNEVDDDVKKKLNDELTGLMDNLQE